MILRNAGKSSSSSSSSRSSTSASMEPGLVTGLSQSESEQLQIIPGDELGQVPLKRSNSKKSAVHETRRVCQICADEVSSTLAGDPFVACNECAFSVCRPCYEYERNDGNQACPQCKTRYQRQKGSPRVEGDEDEDDTDDLDYEFGPRMAAEAMLHDHMSVGRAQVTSTDQPALSLTNGETAATEQEAPEFHAIIVPPSTGTGGGGSSKRVHPFPYVQPGAPVSTRNSQRNFGLYGYGTVSWKERLESWKARNEKYQMVATDESQLSGDTGDESAIVDLPLMDDQSRQPLSRKVPIPSSLINPYRMIIVIRLVVLGFFFRYRITRPVPNAYGLWLTSVICEMWFALSWILDQFPKWHPVVNSKCVHPPL